MTNDFMNSKALLSKFQKIRYTFVAAFKLKLKSIENY